MKLTLKVNRHTTESELIHLGMFFTSLGLNAGAKVASFSPPADPAELDEPEVVHVAASPEQEAAIDKAVGNEPPKRRRRTKDELRVDAIVAENARVAAAEAEAYASNEAALAKLNAEAEAQAGGPYYWSHPESFDFGTLPTREDMDKLLSIEPLIVEVNAEQYAALVAQREAGNVQPAPTPTAPETTSGAAETPATASPSDGKTYTAAEVQQQATVVARTHGADLVKAKIAELGGARIADLNAEQVNTLGAYLFSVK